MTILEWYVIQSLLKKIHLIQISLLLKKFIYILDEEDDVDDSRYDDVNDDAVQIIDQGMLLEMAFDDT